MHCYLYICVRMYVCMRARERKLKEESPVCLKTCSYWYIGETFHLSGLGFHTWLSSRLHSFLIFTLKFLNVMFFKLLCLISYIVCCQFAKNDSFQSEITPFLDLCLILHVQPLFCLPVCFFSLPFLNQTPLLLFYIKKQCTEAKSCLLC